MRARKRRTLVLANPYSGSRSSRRRLRSLLDEVGVANIRWLSGDRLEDAARKAVAQGTRVLAVAGGDGSVNAVARAVAGTPATLAIIPIGTRNHFARDAGIPTNPSAAVRVLAKGRVRRVDVGTVNGHVFVNNSSVGIYPRIIHQREELRRSAHHGKWVATVLAATDVLRRRPLVRVDLDVGSRRQHRRVPFVFVGNNQYAIQGLQVGRRRTLQGGHLAAYVPRRESRLGLLGLSVRALVGKLRDAKDLERHRGRSLRVDSPRRVLRVATDGEVIFLTPPLHYEVRPRALRLLVPEGGDA